MQNFLFGEWETNPIDPLNQLCNEKGLSSEWRLQLYSLGFMMFTYLTLFRSYALPLAPIGTLWVYRSQPRFQISSFIYFLPILVLGNWHDSKSNSVQPHFEKFQFLFSFGLFWLDPLCLQRKYAEYFYEQGRFGCKAEDKNWQKSQKEWVCPLKLDAASDAKCSASTVGGEQTEKVVF